jgi:hypothetical protein
MKKILCLVFALLIPVLMFAGCDKNQNNAATTAVAATEKGGKFTAGIYFIEGDAEHRTQIQIRDQNGNSIAIQYNGKSSTEIGTYTVEGNTLVANIAKTGCKYVFNIEDGKLRFDAQNSIASESFLSDSGITDGTVLYLDHSFEAR